MKDNELISGNWYKFKGTFHNWIIKFSHIKDSHIEASHYIDDTYVGTLHSKGQFNINRYDFKPMTIEEVNSYLPKEKRFPVNEIINDYSIY